MEYYNYDGRYSSGPRADQLEYDHYEYRRESDGYGGQMTYAEEDYSRVDHLAACNARNRYINVGALRADCPTGTNCLPHPSNRWSRPNPRARGYDY